MFADDTAAKEQKAPSPAESQMMAAMMEMGKPGENHKILEASVGSWNYKVKWWMNPQAAPMESTGTTSTKSVMDGRYFISEHSGNMSLPGPDGKNNDLAFKGMGTEGYDNVKKKICRVLDRYMGTGIMMMEGTYDPATKTLTYLGEEEPMPGMKAKVRQVVKTIDQDHRMIEFYEQRGDNDVKTMEITYSRSN